MFDRQDLNAAPAMDLVDMCFNRTDRFGDVHPAVAIDILWTHSVDGYTNWTSDRRQAMREAARTAEARLGITAREYRSQRAEEAHRKAVARLSFGSIGSMGEDWFDETGE